MASSDGIGYLIPENPTPDEMACILVFYPDDPFYLRALLGSLSYLGTWTAWERDISKRGRMAASAWKEANECTYDSMGCLTELVAALSGINTTLAAIQAAIENQEISLDSVDLVNAITGVQLAIENQEIALDTGLLLPALTGIKTAIENQEMVCNCGAGGSDEMGTVNVYCGCGCGNGTGSGTGTGTGDDGVDYRIPPPVEPPVPDIDPGEPPFNPSDAQKCSMANYLVYALRLTLLKIQEQGGDHASFNVWYSALFLGVPNVVVNLAYDVWSWAKQLFTADPVDVSSVFDEFYNTYVCALFSATSAQMAQANILAVLGGSLKPYEELSYTARLVAAELPFELLFQEAGSIEIPNGFANRSCCGETQEDTPALPDLPEGIDYHYELIPMTFDATAGTNEPTTYIKEEKAIGHGYFSSAAIIRTGQQSDARMDVAIYGKSWGFLETKYGANRWDMIGFMIATGETSETPSSPACVQGIRASTNTLLAGTTALPENSKNLLSVPAAIGDEFSASMAGQGWTVQRKIDTNYQAIGAAIPSVTLSTTTVSASYILYNVDRRVVSAYQVIKVDN